MFVSEYSNRAFKVQKYACNGSFRLDRKFLPSPLSPAALKGVDIGVAVVDKFLCQTGTCSLIGSGAVENDLFLLGVAVDPAVKIIAACPDRAGDLQLTGGPVPP